MDALKLCSFMFLTFAVGFLESEVNQRKTITKEPDFTPVCINDTQNILTMIVCRIRTERSRGVECSLLYHYEKGFDHQCDSRFSLITKNQTVFLHLSSLTPADGGNYTCECSNLNGTFIHHLNVTVRENVPNIYIGSVDLTIRSPGVLIPLASMIVSITLVMLGFLYRRRSYRSETFASSEPGCPATPAEHDPDDLYHSLQQPTEDLYQTVSSGHNTEAKPETLNLDSVGSDGSSGDYENL